MLFISNKQAASIWNKKIHDAGPILLELIDQYIHASTLYSTTARYFYKKFRSIDQLAYKMPKWTNSPLRLKILFYSIIYLQLTPKKMFYNFFSKE
jgi:hypothetical protein